MVIQHWMQHHGTDTRCPDFKFEIISAFKDPLRRQLTEAIYINEQGTINNKHEFGVNELNKLECSTTSREREIELKNELENDV